MKRTRQPTKASPDPITESTKAVNAIIIAWQTFELNGGFMAKLLPQRHKELRGKMVELGIDRKMLAYELGLCISTVDARFAGRRPWTIRECYKILNILGISKDQFDVFFPKCPATGF